jgi:hypothetical protein
LCLSPAGLVAARVAEDPAREHHERLRGRPKVHIPAGLVVKSAGQCLGEVAGVGFVCFEVEEGPDLRLADCGVPGPEPADLADRQLEVLKACTGAEALRDEGAL